MASSTRLWLLASVLSGACSGSVGGPAGPQSGSGEHAPVIGGTASGDPAASSEPAPGRTGPRRVSNVEYDNTVRDLLDHTVLLYGGAMHGSDHDARPLPMALIGGARAGIRGDQLVDFSALSGGRPLGDLNFTLLNGYYGLNEASFGA